MAANRKQMAAIVIATMLVLYIAGGFNYFGLSRGFGPAEAIVSLMALLPLVLVGALIWFGVEVISSLRRIEAAVGDESSFESEFSHGS